MVNLCRTLLVLVGLGLSAAAYYLQTPDRLAVLTVVFLFVLLGLGALSESR